MRRFLLALLLVCALPASALGASRFYVSGGGYGHGIGMSQYGAQGYAQHGYKYDAILAHYYTGTALGHADPNQPVEIILRTASSVSISHATKAENEALDARRAYVVSNSGGRLAIGRMRFRSPLSIRGPGWTALNGAGYRGGFLISAVPGGVSVIERTGVDDYIRGVISQEMPSSWEPEALKVQAVAARTYALTSTGVLFPDTRSQAYGGMAAETPTTDAAVRATRGRTVTYDGEPVTTFFFSTSGGRTESIENSFVGSSPQPWLKSVRDPYDSISPVHRWKFTETLDKAGRELAGLYRGRFRGITVLKRGVSPRIVQARILGTRGSTVVTGATIRSRMNLRDTWAYFRGFTGTPKITKPTTPPSGGTQSGGGGAGVANLVRAGAYDGPAQLHVVGEIVPAPRRATVQRWTGRKWKRTGTIRVRRGGAYDFATTEPGRYRVVAAGQSGPAVRLTR